MSARLGTATRTVLAPSALAIQNAVRLLPVAQGMIKRPRVALFVIKWRFAAEIARRWCGLGLLGGGRALRPFNRPTIKVQPLRSRDRQRSRPISTVLGIKWRL